MLLLQDGSQFLLQNGDAFDTQANASTGGGLRFGRQSLSSGLLFARQSSYIASVTVESRRKSVGKRGKYYIEWDGKFWFADTPEQAYALFKMLTDEAEQDIKQMDATEVAEKISISKGIPILETNIPKAKGRVKQATKRIRRFYSERVDNLDGLVAQVKRRERKRKEEQAIMALYL